MLNQAARLADHILTVSDSTRRDLIQEFNINPEKITVTYEGVGESFRPLKDTQIIQQTLSRHQLKSPYFLYVGMIKEHKNIHWLLRLYRKWKKAGKIQSSLVLVGPMDSNYLKKFPEDFKIHSGEGIFHLPSIPQEDLVALYSGATGLIHPSLYEGFGLTLLEAMACGTPVVALRTGSIPEVAGEAADLVNVDDEKEFERAVCRLESDPNHRTLLSERGIEQAKKFRWQEMAAKTAAVYDRLLQNEGV